MNRPEFDLVYRNTLSTLPSNSEKWTDNRSRICQFKLLPFRLKATSVTHDDGSRDYCSDEIIDKIMEVSKTYGGIFDFC